MKHKQITISCPDCGCVVNAIGPIASTNVFAGQKLKRSLDGGWLYQCKQCHLGFRWPRLAKSELDVLYQNGADETWTSTDQSRQDWLIGRKWVCQLIEPKGTVLDMGCFDGGFLEGLTGLYACSGIEIHPQARRRAADKGISIIGANFSEVNGQFDCATSFDVVEHVEYPAIFLAQCLGAVRKGGYLVISSGNMNYITFRFSGSGYRYCTISEHISFISPAWLLGQQAAAGFEIKEIITFSHSSSRFLLSVRFKELVANVLYRIHPSLLCALRKIGFGSRELAKSPISTNHPPCWGTARDHFVAVIQKQ